MRGIISYMSKEKERLTPELAQERVDADKRIDGFFARLAVGETPKAEELDVNYLKQILGEAGADLVPDNLDTVKESLAKPKYSKLHPDRRLGLEVVWDHNGEKVVADYEAWALKMSADTCPRATFKKKGEVKAPPIEDSQDRGLKLMLADLTELVVGGDMSVEDFVRRTDVRVRFGMAYAEMKRVKENFGKESQEYQGKSEEYKRMDKAADTKGLYMVPVGSLEKFWNSIRSGGLPR